VLGRDLPTTGASNAIRTAGALKRKGVEIMEMSRKGWSVSEESVDALLEQLQILASKDDILVLQCLDSRRILETDSNGNVHLPKRGEDGKVHVKGWIIVAKDLLLEILLDQLDPVFRSRKESLIMLVCPLTRFLITCCDAHVKGDSGEREGEGKRMLKELGTLRREIKSRLLGKKRKCTGSDRPVAKRIRLDSSSSAGRGKGGGGGGKGASGKGGYGSRNGDGRGPASGKKKKGFGGK
jgi:hypothetical protein